MLLWSRGELTHKRRRPVHPGGGLTLRPGWLLEIPCRGGADRILALALGALERSDTGVDHGRERKLARRHEARDPCAHGDIAAAGPGARMMNEEVAHPLHHDLRILARLVRRIALSQYRERAAVPAPDQIAATAVGGRDHARDAAQAG